MRSSKPSISIVGPGNLGSALAQSLANAGFRLDALVLRPKASSRRRAMALARRLKTHVLNVGTAPLISEVVWITVPDDQIASTAAALAGSQEWKGKLVFHSSGALTSDELKPLRKRGARVASVHPMMTFVRGATPAMRGVMFSLEGDATAVRAAREIVAALGARSFVIARQSKVLYHAFGSFASPMVVALLAAMEQVALAAGISRRDIKPMMAPLLGKTWGNYLAKDAASAFSGPLVRGDVATVRKHLRELKKVPEAREVYVALARMALTKLPVKKRRELTAELKAATSS